MRKFFFNMLSKDYLTYTDSETIGYLEDNLEKGIVRYGNSELSLIAGSSIGTQRYNSQLRDELISIIENYNYDRSSYILALPLDALYRNSTRNIYGKASWGLGKRIILKALLSNNSLYGSPFCFRLLDVKEDVLRDYSSRIYDLIDSHSVIYVGPMAGKNSKIIKSKKIVKLIKIPEKDAYNSIDDIESTIEEEYQLHHNALVLLVAGASATVLSHRLNTKGIKAYDIGQFTRHYDSMSWVDEADKPKT